MARLFITSFRPGASPKQIHIDGFYEDSAADIYAPFTFFSVAYDPTLSTSVRQQLVDSIVQIASQKLPENNVNGVSLIASDVESIC